MAYKYTALIGLPLEMRELIYQQVLLDASQGPQILRVCQSIHFEARKFLYQRPIIFRSQKALNEWLAQRPNDVLQDVQEISLELQDVDLSPILMPVSPAGSSERSRSLQTWDLYETDLDALDQAFKKLPNVTALTIRALEGRQTHLYEVFLAKVLQMIASHWPALQDLSLGGNMHNQSLRFMETLGALNAFCFDGFSATEPAETAAMLSRHNLTRITIASQPTLLTPTRGQHSNITYKSQSFDSSVLRKIDRLASLSISERVPTAASSALFFTSEILGSLHALKTLAVLSLRLSHTPDEHTLDALDDLLKRSTSIERLELDWPHLNPVILYILTNRLKFLWIRAADLTAASDILAAILESREDGGVQGLRRVVLVRSVRAAEPIVDEMDCDNDDVEDDGSEYGDVSG